MPEQSTRVKRLSGLRARMVGAGTLLRPYRSTWRRLNQPQRLIIYLLAIVAVAILASAQAQISGPQRSPEIQAYQAPLEHFFDRTCPKYRLEVQSVAPLRIVASVRCSESRRLELETAIKSICNIQEAKGDRLVLMAADVQEPWSLTRRIYLAASCGFLPVFLWVQHLLDWAGERWLAALSWCRSMLKKLPFRKSRTKPQPQPGSRRRVTLICRRPSFGSRSAANWSTGLALLFVIAQVVVASNYQHWTSQPKRIISIPDRPTREGGVESSLLEALSRSFVCQELCLFTGLPGSESSMIIGMRGLESGQALAAARQISSWLGIHLDQIEVIQLTNPKSSNDFAFFAGVLGLSLAALFVAIDPEPFSTPKSLNDGEQVLIRRTNSLIDRDPGHSEIKLEFAPNLLRADRDGEDFLGRLNERFVSVRKHLLMELGILIPSIRVRDNFRLKAGTFRILVRDQEAAVGTLQLGRVLAVGPRQQLERLPGELTKDPTYGMDAKWLQRSDMALSERQGCMNFDDVSVATTLLTEVLRTHASSLLSFAQVCDIAQEPNLQAVSAELEKVGVDRVLLWKVLRLLLAERVSIHHHTNILETLLLQSRQHFLNGKLDQNAIQLAESVRSQLGTQLCSNYANSDKILRVMVLDPSVESAVSKAAVYNCQGILLNLEPGQAQEIVEAVRSKSNEVERLGVQPILLVSPTVRAAMRHLVEDQMPGLVVLSWNEIARGYQSQSLGMVSLASTNLGPASK